MNRLFLMHTTLVIVLGAILILNGCELAPPVYDPSRPETALVKLAPDEWPTLTDDMDYDGLIDAIDQSLLYFSRVPDERRFRFGFEEYSRAHMFQSLELLKEFVSNHPEPNRLQEFIQQHYVLYRSVGRAPDSNVLFTGYFEPLYPGSLEPSEIYNVPVYGIPEDLVSVNLSLFVPEWRGKRIVGRVEGRQLQPYHTREKILMDGVIAETAPIIAWLKDPIDLYFLQVQGSGRVQTPEGQQINILYAAQNGHTADLVGRHLIRENKIPREEMSMQRIREYFEEHPDEIAPMINQDPSFVFFRIGSTGPLGNLGVEVTPGRSIATDRHIFPSGALAFISTQKPLVAGDRSIARWVPLNRFVLNQDTGGAIKGPGRVDLFWGTGDYAETAAGHLKHDGALYFLVLKPRQLTAAKP
jgi:membrane-bound lytic murein transglycosylase A